MKVFRDDERLLKSVPIKTSMLGMMSTTTQMQQAGWEFSAEQMPYNMTVRLIARHQGAKLYAMSNQVSVNFFEAVSDPRVFSNLLFTFNHVGSHMRVELHVSSMDFRPIDAMPQFTTGKEIKDIEDFGIFATPLVRTNEIIVPEESVSDLLNKILEYQEPTKAKYMKQKLYESREGMDMDAVPQQKFHAQVISISNAA